MTVTSWSEVVRLCWRGVTPINLSAPVRYYRIDEGGVSHFRLWRDNLLISWMHTRMVIALLFRMFSRPRPRRIRA